MIKFSGYYVDGTIIQGIDKVVDGVKMVMAHQKGTRAYDRKYGSSLDSLLFETITDDMKIDAEILLQEILEKERRVSYISNSLELIPHIDENTVELKFSVQYKSAKIDFVYFRDNNA